MPPSLSSREAAQRLVDQGAFDFLVPVTKPLMRPDEAARFLHRERQHIYDLIAEGKLEAHAPQDREKQRYVVTTRSVKLVLAETALYDPAQFIERILSLFTRLNGAQLAQILAEVTRLRAKL